MPFEPGWRLARPLWMGLKAFLESDAGDVIVGCGKARLLRHESDTFIAD